MPFSLASAFGVAAIVSLTILPGLALLRACLAAPRDPIERVGLAAGIGLAIVPLAWLLGGRWDSASWWWVIAIALVMVGSQALTSDWLFEWRASLDRAKLDHRPAPGGGTAVVALIAVLIVQLAFRWYAARTVTVPLWADSVHHAMIAELFVRHGSLPDSWLPLSPLATFTYHFGFHAVVASVAQMTGLAVPRAVVVVGQSLMVLQALTAAGLATGLTGRRWAGVAAAVVVGGLGPMPGTYLTWGRYTQLAGQAVLPAALLATARAVRGPAVLTSDDDRFARWRVVGRILVAAVAVAGLALTHYVVEIFFVAAVGAWWLVTGGWTGPAPRPHSARWLALLRLGVVALIAIALAIPWVPRFLAGNLDTNAVALATERLPGDVWGAVSFRYVLEHFGQWVGVALTAATLLAIAVGLVRRDRVVAAATLWIAGLIAASYPQAFGIPITGPLKDFTVLIGLYVPASLAIGAVAGRAIDAWLETRLAPDPPLGPTDDGIDEMLRAARRPRSVVLYVCVALAAVLGWRQRDVIQPDHVIATPADEAALAWVKVNTPPDAVFLASGAPTYGDTVVLGDDGGWWLPVLAGRACTIPPLPIGHERTVEPDYRQRTVALAKAVASDLGAPATVALLKREGVGWAYVGPTAKALSAGKLAAAGGWRKVYDAGGASVWAAGWGDSFAWGGPHPPTPSPKFGGGGGRVAVDENRIPYGRRPDPQPVILPLPQTWGRGSGGEGLPQAP